MNENDERKRYCDNKVYQTSRPKRLRLEGPSIEALEVKESNLAKLPLNSLQLILSFMDHEKLSQMRKVCKSFNEISKKVLGKGHIELKNRIKIEIEKAEKKVLFSTNLRSSYDMLRFLNGLHVAINNCTVTYAFHIDYFVAGKLLDEANCLLEDFNSSTVVPYIQEHVYDEKPHLFLNRIIAHSERAHQHFFKKILEKFIYYDEEASFERFQQNRLDIDLQIEKNDMRILKTNLLLNLRQKIDCGNQMKREFLNLISKLHEKVLKLTQRAKKEDEEVERIIKGKDMSMDPLNNGLTNCLFQFSAPFSSTLKVTNTSLKRSNLAALPSSCIKNIVSYFNYNKMAHLRIVCKSFNEVCKTELNREFEKLKQEFQIKIQEQSEVDCAHKVFANSTNFMKDICNLLQLCKNNYKWHLGSKYYFAAGKVLDEAKCLYDELHRPPYSAIFMEFDYNYHCRPHFLLIPLMDIVYKAIAHFKFNIVPKYFSSTQKQIYVPSFIFTGDVINIEKESHLNLGEIEKLIDETDVKIKEQNDINRKYLKIISGLKKKIIILSKEISERIFVLKKLKENLF